MGDLNASVSLHDSLSNQDETAIRRCLRAEIVSANIERVDLLNQFELEREFSFIYISGFF